MQNEVKKITRLVDEVTSLLMRSGSNDINIRIKRDSELSTITIIDYNSAYPNDEISSLNDVLNIQTAGRTFLPYRRPESRRLPDRQGFPYFPGISGKRQIPFQHPDWYTQASFQSSVLPPRKFRLQSLRYTAVLCT